MSLQNFGFVDSVGQSWLLRGAMPDAAGVRTLANFHAGLILAFSPVTAADALTEARMKEIRVAGQWIDMTTVDLGLVRRLVRKIHATLRGGVTMYLCDSHGRERVGLIVGAWRVLVNEWSPAFALIEASEFGCDWLSSETEEKMISCFESLVPGFPAGEGGVHERESTAGNSLRARQRAPRSDRHRASAGSGDRYIP